MVSLRSGLRCRHSAGAVQSHPMMQRACAGDQAPLPPAPAACLTGTVPPRGTESPTVWAAWGRHPRTRDRHATTASGHCLVGYPKCSTTYFVNIGVVKYSSTARSRASRPDTATILPLSLQENVRSPSGLN